jgi:hypothetical protein
MAGRDGMTGVFSWTLCDTLLLAACWAYLRVRSHVRPWALAQSSLSAGTVRAEAAAAALAGHRPGKM